jgi:hypothetical protein
MASNDDMNDEVIKRQIQQNIEVTEALKKMLLELDKKSENKKAKKSNAKAD